MSAPSGPGDLYALANEFLAACVAAVATAPGGPIARAYVSPGPPAWDCEQITVHVGGAAYADTRPLQPPLQPMFRVADTGNVNLIALTLTILRCVPVVTGDGSNLTWPSPLSMDDTAVDIIGDLWAVWNYVRKQYADGNLFHEPDGRKREFIFDPALPLITQGGFGGWQLQVRVRLDGYGAVL